MSEPAKIEVIEAPPITRGYVQATLGEALRELRVATRQLEKLTGVRSASIWEFIDEADAVRWAK